jgi:uncharacterized protein YgbK (DUF1537 family)
VAGLELFVCGTQSDACRRFVLAARAGGTPVFSLPKELVWGAGFTNAAAQAISQKVAASLRSHSRAILNVGLRTLHERTIARRLVTHLAQVAALVLRRTDVEHVYAEGGATAAELAHAMGWARLRVLRELAPGVATLTVDGGRALRLTIKPGSYTWPERVWHQPSAACARQLPPLLVPPPTPALPNGTLASRPDRLDGLTL